MTTKDMPTTRVSTRTTDYARIECNVCDARATLNRAPAIRGAEITTFIAAHQHPSDRGFRVCIRAVVDQPPTVALLAMPPPA